MIITVHTKPNSKKTEIVTWNNDLIVIKVHAQAKNGEANKELIKFLAKHLSVAKTLIEIKKGKNSKIKHIKIPD